VTEARQTTHEQVPFAVKGAFKAIHGYTSRVLEAHGVHFGQHYLLMELYREDGQTVGGLTERLGVEGPTVVKTVQRMEATGLVRRQADPADRRRVLVYLTPQGRELEAVVPDLLADVARQAVAGMSPAEVAALLRALSAIRANLA
jgi:DNA-binding MarR family transcriptional regulator